MTNQNNINIFLFITTIFLIIITIVLFCKVDELQTALNSEHLTPTSISINEGIQNLSSVYNSGNASLTNLTLSGGLKIGALTIDNNGNISTTGTITSGDHNINGSINVSNGGNFNGGRYYFNDIENCGKLRVGCAWGKPGIYAEIKDQNCSTCSGDLVIGSSTSNVSLQNGTSVNFIGSQSVSGNITFGTPGSSDYTLLGSTDGVRICTGGPNDSQRLWFKRNPGQRNV